MLTCMCMKRNWKSSYCMYIIVLYIYRYNTKNSTSCAKTEIRKYEMCRVVGIIEIERERTTGWKALLQERENRAQGVLSTVVVIRRSRDRKDWDIGRSKNGFLGPHTTLDYTSRHHSHRHGAPYHNSQRVCWSVPVT